MAIPTDLVASVNEGRCILFLGAMASAARPPDDVTRFSYDQSPPGGTELSQRLAKKFGYPYPDDTNLQRVSLFVETQRSQRRSGLINAILAESRRTNSPFAGWCRQD